MVSNQLSLALCACLATAGCTGQDPASSAIAKEFAESKGILVNLATAVPGTWEKVCVLGPYSNNDTAKQTLGFEWDAEAKTSIQTNEGIALLILVQETKVIAFVEPPRRYGDFSNLTTQCFPKHKAKFSHDSKPTKGWPGLFPKNVE